MMLMFYEQFERFWHALLYFPSIRLSLASSEFQLALISNLATQKELKQVDKTASNTFKSSITGPQRTQQNDSPVWHLAFNRYRQVLLIVVFLSQEKGVSQRTGY